MPDFSTAESGAAKPDGIVAHLSALLGAKLEYLRARFRLAEIEGKEAGLRAAVVVALLAIAIVAVIFGYLFLVLAIVFLIALAFDGGHAWIWVLLGAAVFHVLVAAILGLIAKSRLKAPFFPLSVDELKKDQEWLKQTTKPN